MPSQPVPFTTNITATTLSNAPVSPAVTMAADSTLKISGDLYIDGQIIAHGAPPDAIDIIEELMIMREILLNNAEFKAEYEKIKLIKKLSDPTGSDGK